MSDESIAGSPEHYDPGSPEYHPMSPPQYPAPGDYPRSPSYPPSWPGGSPQYPGSPLSSPRYVPTSPSNYPESPRPEFSSNVVASGGFEFYCPKPEKLSFEIDKIFGLVKADNSVLKFRMVITGQCHSTSQIFLKGKNRLLLPFLKLKKINNLSHNQTIWSFWFGIFVT